MVAFDHICFHAKTPAWIWLKFGMNIHSLKPLGGHRIIFITGVKKGLVGKSIIYADEDAGRG